MQQENVDCGQNGVEFCSSGLGGSTGAGSADYRHGGSNFNSGNSDIVADIAASPVLTVAADSSWSAAETSTRGTQHRVGAQNIQQPKM